MYKYINVTNYYPVFKMAAMAACKNTAGLLASRFFLGITEAGLFPGVIFYLTLWYTRGEQATRVAFFFSCSTLAGAFGGVLVNMRIFLQNI
jgi:MFS family permease